MAYDDDMRAGKLTMTLRERLKQSFLFYDSYLFVRNRVWLVGWFLNGRAAPPPLVKQQCVLEYQRKFGIPILVETGTYRGEMVRATRSAFKEIYSIELNTELHAYVQRMFARFPHIRLLQGDSSVVLRDLLPHIQSPCLFWLDAHNIEGNTGRKERETPVMAELECIMNHPVKEHVILIDDARLFDGTNDYPLLAEVTQFVSQRRPERRVSVADDIIRITLPERPRREKEQ